MNKSYTIREIDKCLEGNYTLSGDAQLVNFDELKPWDKAEGNSLVFIDKTKNNKIELAKATKARQVICDFDPEDDLKSKCFIRVKEPRLAFMKIANRLFQKRYSPHIHRSALISKT